MTCSIKYGGGEFSTRIWWGKLREIDHVGDPSVDGRLIIRWIITKCDVVAWIGLFWHRLGTDVGHL